MDGKTLDKLVAAPWSVRVHALKSGESSLTIDELDGFEVFGSDDKDVRSAMADSLRAHLMGYETVGRPIPVPVESWALPQTVTYSSWRPSMVVNMSTMAGAV